MDQEHATERQPLQLDFPATVRDSRIPFAARLFQLALAEQGRRGSIGCSIDSQLHLQGQDMPLGPVLPPASARRKASLIVPGLFGDSVRSLVAPMALAEASLELQHYEIDVAWVNGRRGCDRNAADLYPQVMRLAARKGTPIHLIGYSKGCPDILHLLANYTQCHEAIHSVVALAGVVYGTPLAHQTPSWLDRLVQHLPLPGVAFGDGRALDDLSPEYRRAWLEHNALPASIRYGSVVACPRPEQVSRVLWRSYRRLAAVDRKNDGQVIASDSILPQGELLAAVNADHWAIALPIAQRMRWLSSWLVNRNDFPRTLLLQAIIDHMDS